MQFLYADGTDAHFMDSESFEQIAIPEATRRRAAASGRARTTRSTCCSSTTSRPTSSCRAPSSSRSRRPSPGLRGDTASGGGTKPATLETGAPGAACRCSSNIGDRVQASTRAPATTCRARSDATVPAAATSAARRVRALPARPHRAPARRDVFERDAAPFTRALAHAALDDASRSSTRCIDRHAKGWTLDRIAPLERAILRVALLEMLHPDARAGRAADPARGRDRRGGRDARRRSAAPRRPASSTASSPRCCATCARMRARHERARRASSTLIERLERAAAQLRSGELDADARRRARRGVRARSPARPRAELDRRRAPRRPAPPPGRTRSVDRGP